MRLLRQTLLSYRQGSSDKVYEVDLCEVGPGRFVVNHRFGRRGANLREGTETPSPVGLADAERIFAKVVRSKIDKGYQEGAAPAPPSAGERARERERQGGLADAPAAGDRRAARVLARLQQGEVTFARRGRTGGDRRPFGLDRAIWRAGELRLSGAVPLLAQLAGSGTPLRDYCVAFAIGKCARPDHDGEREQGSAALARLLRSNSDAVRRIAALGLRALTVGPEREEMAQNLSERLPPALRRAVRDGGPQPLADALRDHLAGSEKDRYDALFTLYLVLQPAQRPALLDLLRTMPLRGGTFRALRHLFKAAEFDEDVELFGILAHRFEREQATFRLRSSYRDRYRTSDGNQLSGVEVKRRLADASGRLAFGDKTRDYLRRRVWRTLRRMGRLGDRRYVGFAVGVLLPYSDEDAVPPRSRVRWHRGRTETVEVADRFAPYWAFNQILHGQSPRHVAEPRRTHFALRSGGAPATAQRSESFPRLWEECPEGLLHLLAESRCEVVHVFAIRAVRACPVFLSQLDIEATILLLGRPYEVTAELGFELAKDRYRSAGEPDRPLVLALSSCVFPPGRAQAHRWIDERREYFLRDGDFVLGLCTSVQGDTRAFALRFLRSANLAGAQAEVLIGRLLAYLLALGAGRGDEARDGGAILLAAFAGPLRTIGEGVILDLLQHPLREVQELGGQLLLQHERGAWAWPEALLLSLVRSPFESLRAIGVRFLGQLPDEALRTRQRLLIELVSHAQPDLRNAARPLLRRLAGAYRDLGDELVLLLSDELLKRELFEGVHRALLLTLRDELSAHLGALSLARVLLLIAAPGKAAQDLGAERLGANPAWADEMDTLDIVRLGSHELQAVREACLQLFGRIVPRIKANREQMPEEMIKAVGLLDAKWDDTRAAAFQLFRGAFGEAELSPGILITICDSVREDVQRFGRELLGRYFRDEAGAEYLAKLCEHPAPDMQLLVTNYLERFAAGDVGRLQGLLPYLASALSRVNRGRIAKARLYDFLAAEGQKSDEAAQLVLPLLSRLAATISVEGRARCIEAMVAIGRARPALPLPLSVKAPPLRAAMEARRGV